MKIKELMTRGARWIEPGGSAAQAARQMKAYAVGLLPVCELGRLVGVLTDRDIVVRAVAEGRDPKSTTAGELMSPDPVWCSEDDELEEAARVMEGWRVRRLPVLDAEHRLVGVVSLDDIARPDERRALAGEVLEKTAGRRPPPFV